MKRCLACSLIATALCVSPVMAQAGGRGFPLQVASTTVVGEEAGLVEITAAAIGPSGTVYVVDHVAFTVSAFSPEGRMLWRVGRKGQGPGEYTFPYRVAAAPDGTVLVFDLGRNDVTRLSSEGRFIDRASIPLRFPVTEDMIATAGEVLISGYTSTQGTGRQHGIHRFRRRGADLLHAGSFGPLPTVRDTAILRYWGAGDISRAANGDLLFALALPYVVYRFDSTGRQKMAARPTFRVRGTPDDVVKIERQGREARISNTRADVDRPWTIVEVTNGMILVTRLKSQVRHWDLFTAAGAFVGSREYPADWGVAVGFDRIRNLLWMVATHDDAPVLVRLQLAGAPTPSRRSR